MQMLYNSESFVVVQFDVPAQPETGGASRRGGYEIVDKLAGKEIFIEGVVAESFKAGVQSLIDSDRSPDQFDDYIAGFTVLAQQPVVMH